MGPPLYAFDLYRQIQTWRQLRLRFTRTAAHTDTDTHERCEMREARNERRDTSCEMPEAGNEMRDARCEMRDARCEMQETRYEIRDTRYEIRDARYEMRDARSKKRDAGYRNYRRRLVDTFVNKSTPSIYTGMRAREHDEPQIPKIQA